MNTRLLMCSLLLSVIWNVNGKPYTILQAESSFLTELDDVAVTRWTIPFFKTGEKKYYLGTFFKANWFKALQYCRYHGMDLASISSQKENDDLVQYIIDSGYGIDHFWVSGTDLAEKGKFFWMSNGRPIDIYTFDDWAIGEPNNKGGSENCLQIADRGEGLKWNDVPCDLQQYFICEAVMIR